MVVRIQQLSAQIANQIAAGEVIERPASVVKELLENAFDAQATFISIEIGFGGLNQIKISDNGVGILAEDLPLAIAAHATSKISKLSDLYAIETMGFRGEALASIASIARCAISSKPAEQTHAMKLELIDGKVKMLPCARQQGTTIEVRDIFFNAPVRKKFLKSEQSEFQAIAMVVKRFAMSAPHIALQLKHNEQLLMNLPAALCEHSQLKRLSKLMGKAFVTAATYINIEHGHLQLRGWLANASYQRSQNDKQWIYLNQRMIKDKLINHAIKQAYEPILYPGRQPACLLYLSVDPTEVDVNVHPTKHEVRFTQPRLIHDFLLSQMQAVLQIKPAGAPSYVQENLAPSWRVQESLPLFTSDNTLQLQTIQRLLIDQQFHIIAIAQQLYLIDVPAFKKLQQKQELLESSLPLTNRSLLVPLIYTATDCTYSDQQVMLLKQVGVEIELEAPASLKINSLPLIIPQLDIYRFLDLFFASLAPTLKDTMLLLLECQTDCEHFNPEQETHLYNYVAANQHLLDNSSACKKLSSALCREILYA